LPPFEIAAATIEGQAAVRDFRAQLPPQSVNQMQREIQDLKAKLANVEPNSAMPLLENPSFESAGPNEEILGWQVDPANRGRIELDRQTSYDGNGSLAVHGTGESLRVRSTALVSPATGRVTITAWIRSDEANALPPRFTIEGDDGESSVRSFSVEPTAVPNRTSEPWRQFAAHFDELPVDARQLRIGFDSSQAGSVWIDRVEIHDRWLDQSEVQSLKQLLNLASFKLQEQGDAVGCLRILESYWPRFVDDQYSSTVESARAPELPSGERRLK
jgi:hypothetical protein